MKDKYDSLKENGILKIKKIDMIRGCNINILSKILEINLTGVECELKNMRCISIHFWIYKDGSYRHIDGEERIPLNPEEREQFAYIGHLEHEKMFEIMGDMIEFMGNEKEYWCLYDGETLFIYQMVSQNEKKMSELFSKGHSTEPIIYIAFYGMYRAMVKDKDVAIQSGFFNKVSDISFVFDAGDNIIRNCEDLFVQYYHIYLEIFRIFKSKINPVFYRERKEEGLRLKIEEILKNNTNEKLQLYFIDEQLLILYILAWKKEMVELARGTLKLCEKYGHLEGIKLREFLMRDETCFCGDDFQIVYEFVRGYIWI